jgi:hypothetical protein
MARHAERRVVQDANVLEQAAGLDDEFESL